MSQNLGSDIDTLGGTKPKTLTKPLVFYLKDYFFFHPVPGPARDKAAKPRPELPRRRDKGGADGGARRGARQPPRVRAAGHVQLLGAEGHRDHAQLFLAEQRTLRVRVRVAALDALQWSQTGLTQLSTYNLYQYIEYHRH